MSATSRCPKAGDHSSIVSGSTSRGFLVGWRRMLERYGAKSYSVAGTPLAGGEAGLGIRVQVLDLLGDLGLRRHVVRGEQGLGCGGRLLEHDRG